MNVESISNKIRIQLWEISHSLGSKLNEIQETQVPHFTIHQNFLIKLPEILNQITKPLSNNFLKMTKCCATVYNQQQQQQQQHKRKTSAIQWKWQQLHLSKRVMIEIKERWKDEYLHKFCKYYYHWQNRSLTLFQQRKSGKHFWKYFFLIWVKTVNKINKANSFTITN